MRLQAVSENAIMLYVGEVISPDISAMVQASTTVIERTLGADLIDLIPAYASVLIIYDPFRCTHINVIQRLRAALEALSMEGVAGSRSVVLPVYYAPESGADLEALADRAGLSTDDVITLHSCLSYRVYAIGFAPGFAYLGEVDERIATPRLTTPRPAVPRGAVAIADRQTAVYPSVSPGGWNLIGLCPVAMFTPQAEPNMPIAVGDQVRFEPIDRADFLALGGELQ